MAGATLGAELAMALKGRGVEVVFGVPGVHNIELYRGLEEAGIRHVLARHEQGAGFMADGYARASGRPGVAFVITGPGLTNILTPLGQAWSDSVPLLVISSCLPEGEAMPGRLHQMRDQPGAARAVCAHSHMARSAEEAFELLDSAFTALATGRKRPWHLSIPIDLLARPAGPAPQWAPARVDLPQAPEGAAARLAKMLGAAERPLFIFGGGAVGAAEAAREVVRRSGAAVFTTYAGRGVVPASHPLSFGAFLARPDSAAVIARADLVVAVGTELAEVDLWREDLGRTGPLVRIDIDASVLADAHGAEFPIHAEAGAFLAALSPLLGESPPKWEADEVARARAAFRAQSAAERPGIAEYVDALRTVLDDTAHVYSDMTQFAYVAKELYPMEEPGRWHHPFGFGTLGYALPAAIGGKLARPEADVVAIAGDYGFQYTLQELGVAAELGLALPLVVWDNDRLQEIEDSMVRSQIAPRAVRALNPDFGLLARAWGLGYARADTPQAFGLALRAALGAERPVLVHAGPGLRPLKTPVSDG